MLKVILSSVSVICLCFNLKFEKKNVQVILKKCFPDLFFIYVLFFVKITMKVSNVYEQIL